MKSRLPLIPLLALSQTVALVWGEVVLPEAPFRVWTHPEGIASTGPIQENQIRQSPFYDVSVSASSQSEAAVSSFVYMSIPRSGKPKPNPDRTDGAEFAAEASLTMSWTTILTGDDVWVTVRRADGRTIDSLDEVTLRPTTLSFSIEKIGPESIQIHVPYREQGHRFSIEFKDDLFTAYSDVSGISGTLSEHPEGRAIHEEPRNALMIFVEPHVRPDLQPDEQVYYPKPGDIPHLDAIDADVIYFQPGLYLMPWNDHAQLSPKVRRIYLAPGAYVKGAFEFQGERGAYTVSGSGVLSGESYVYEADKSTAFNHTPYEQRSALAQDCHGSCVKMLQFWSSAKKQHLRIQGITLVEPPYHTFTVYGDTETFRTDISHYKQIGAWYWQTDGIEILTGGSLSNSFLHANDDAIKLYHSDVTVKNCVIWKGENGPVIQWGWIPRSLDHVHVDGIDIIHNRMYWKDIKANTGILNSSRHWDGEDQTRGDPLKTIQHLTLKNIRSEGMNHSAFRFHVLSNWKDIKIENLWIEKWNELDPISQQSTLNLHGNSNLHISGFKLINYNVGNTPISTDAGNAWYPEKGRLHIPESVRNSIGIYTKPKAKEGRQTMQLFIGSYTQGSTNEVGISLAEVDTKTSQLSFEGVLATPSNPSWVILSEDHKTLFSVSEEPKGKSLVHRYTIDGSNLFHQASAPSKGSGTCHLFPKGDLLFASSYGSGMLSIFNTSENSLALLQEPHSYPSPKPRPGGKTSSHAHYSACRANARWLLVCDLGSDRIWTHDLSTPEISIAHETVTPDGRGPRHLAFHPALPLVYVLCELDPWLMIYSLDEISGKLSLIAEYDLREATQNPDFGWSSAIRIHPSGKILGVGDRATHSVCLFLLDDNGRVTFNQAVRSDGKTPRDFNFSPDGSTLVIAYQNSNQIYPFRFDDQLKVGPALTPIDVYKPVSLVFRRIP